MIRFVKVKSPKLLCKQFDISLYTKHALFYQKELLEIHTNRVDRIESFDRLTLTRDTCTVSLYKHNKTQEIFIKFGCIFIIETKKLFEKSDDEVAEFCETLRKRFLLEHFKDSDSFKIIEAYKEFFSILKSQLNEKDS